MKKSVFFISCLIVAAGAAAVYFLYLNPARTLLRSKNVIAFIRNPQDHQEWIIPAGASCANAPFSMPTTGFIGYLWGDTFNPPHQHQGIDIFSGTEAGVTEVYAAYDGYLTRLSDWKSSLIIRIPDDPLLPGRQIWTYYTHMADTEGHSLIVEAFPPGTHEVFVKAGTYLGNMGNYSGTPGNPTGVHLHFSIVKDDGTGKFLNELEIGNTLDPSPYFNLPLNANTTAEEIPLCLP
jgi:murein DD-endopeptidase MepM/ murein hydrolase activator NlpD